MTTYASEYSCTSGSFFFLLCLLCFAQEDRSPPSAGGRDVVGLVFAGARTLAGNPLPTGLAGVQMESVWAADIVDGEANAGPVWQRFRAP